MSEWRTLSIDQLCSAVTSGGTPSRSQPEYFTPPSVPWVKTGDLHDAYLTEYDERISEEGVRNSSAKILPQETVLMAMYGATVGQLGILDEPATCNQAACAMIADPEICVARWLFYCLLNDRTRIVSRATGAAQQNLSARTIKGFAYDTPSVPEQHAIAEVLGALDDKIAANAKLIQSAGVLSATLFDDMLDCSVDVPLSSTAQFINGRAFTKDASGTGRVVIRIAELNSGIGGSTVYSDADVDNDYLALPGDLLFAWSGSLTVHRWFRPEAIVNQHIFKVVPRDGYPIWVVYELLRRKLDDFRAIAADKATTMGHIQRHHLDEAVSVPAHTTIAARMEFMSGLWESSLNKERESLALAVLRDTLLPQLMSGKLRVKDAEKQVEEAV